MRFLGYPGWMLRCFYAVVEVPGVVAKLLLWNLGWLLSCCYAVARVPREVIRVLLCGC